MKKAARILMVDDDPAIVQMFSDMLRTDGYEVWEASSGQQALEVTRARRPDVVLLDVVLPDLSGLEVCRQIKADAALPDVFVVLFSGHATDPAHKVDGFATGANDYIARPLAEEEFLARIRTLVRLQHTTAALRVSEQHYRRLVDILPDAVGLTNLHGRVTAVNRQAVEMLGYGSPEELMQKTVLDLTEPQAHERMRADMAATLEEGVKRSSMEYVLLRKNGEPFPVELSAAALRGPDGKPTGLVALARDITQRKRATEALQASEERFRQLAENIREVFWMTDPRKNEMIYISPGYEQIWGRTCASLYASPRNWIEAIHPADRPRVLEAALTKQTCGQYDEVYRIVRPDGSTRWIHDRAFPIRDDSGRVYRVAGTAEDITQRHHAEEALREAEARYRSIFENATEGIFRSTPQGRLLAANPAMARMFGYPSLPQALSSITDIGKQIYVRPERRAELKELLQSQGSVQDFEAENYRKDGTKIWISLNVHVVRSATGAVLCYEGTCQDITERKRFEEELRQLPRLIIEAQETERQRVARELHDSVNQILASARMRLRKVEESATEFRPSTREILARCQALLVKALEENRRIAHDLRPSDLDQLGFTVACRNLAAEFSLRTNLAVKCYLTRFDQRLSPLAGLNLFRIVQEVFTNIEKHARATSVRLSISRRGDFICLKIQDDGCGIPAKTATVSPKKRAGIGLTNIRERAAALGGTCEVISRPSKGTTVAVRVPVKPSP